MKRTTLLLTPSLFALLFFLPSAISSAATTCIEPPPLKPIHCICGVVFFATGDRIANATVTIMQEDKEIAVRRTDDEGKFAFEGLKPGKYEIRVFANGFTDAGTKIVLVRPQARLRRVLAVNMHLNGCSSVSLADPSKLEKELNPSGS